MLVSIAALSVISYYLPLSNLIINIPLDMPSLNGTASADELWAENKRLSAENAELRIKLADSLDIKRENERLRKYFDIKEENPSYKIVPAEVVRRDSAEDFYGFTINAGTSSGIKVNDTVITENGLVGWISRADKSSSAVTTILSPQTKVSVIDSESGDCGILCGSGSLCDKNLAVMQNITTENSIKSDDLIVTSGIGGVYLKNLVVGRVENVSVSEYDSSVSAEISPCQQISDITDIAVIIQNN